MNNESAKAIPTRSPTPRAKRRHPAKKSRIAALACSLAATSGLAAIMFQSNQIMAATSGPIATAAPANISAKTPAIGSTAKTSSANTSTGTFTGVVSPNKFGNVQVRITVAGTKLTDVVALQTPNGKQKSVRINDRAVPVPRGPKR